MKKLKKKIKDFIYVVNYPLGVDEQWDKESIDSFGKFLDGINLILSIAVFVVPALSLLTILIQNYGK